MDRTERPKKAAKISEAEHVGDVKSRSLPMLRQERGLSAKSNSLKGDVGDSEKSVNGEKPTQALKKPVSIKQRTIDVLEQAAAIGAVVGANAAAAGKAAGIKAVAVGKVVGTKTLAVGKAVGGVAISMVKLGINVIPPSVFIGAIVVGAAVGTVLGGFMAGATIGVAIGAGIGYIAGFLAAMLGPF